MKKLVNKIVIESALNENQETLISDTLNLLNGPEHLVDFILMNYDFLKMSKRTEIVQSITFKLNSGKGNKVTMYESMDIKQVRTFMDNIIRFENLFETLYNDLDHNFQSNIGNNFQEAQAKICGKFNANIQNFWNFETKDIFKDCNHKELYKNITFSIDDYKKYYYCNNIVNKENWIKLINHFIETYFDGFHLVQSKNSNYTVFAKNIIGKKFILYYSTSELKTLLNFDLCGPDSIFVGIVDEDFEFANQSLFGQKGIMHLGLLGNPYLVPIATISSFSAVKYATDYLVLNNSMQRKIVQIEDGVFQLIHSEYMSRSLMEYTAIYYKLLSYVSNPYLNYLKKSFIMS